MLSIEIYTTPEEYYLAMYRYLNLMYMALDTGGIIVTQVPIYDGTKIKNIRSQFNKNCILKNNPYLNKLFETLKIEYAKHNIVLEYKHLSIKIIRNLNSPERLPSINLSILANL
jgi:hypothetical protein